MLAANSYVDGVTINLFESGKETGNIIDRFDLSFSVGLSIKIAGRVDLSARYTFGLLPAIIITNNDTIRNGFNMTIPSPDRDWFNRVLQIGLGVRF
jgi:hypothetical protein